MLKRSVSFKISVLLACFIFYTNALSSQCDQISRSDIELLVPEIQPAVGEMFCLPISVANFIDVTAVDFDILFDSEILRYESFDPLGFPGFINSNEALTGRLKYLAFPPELLTLADNTELVQLCFTVIGESGDFSPIVFSNTEIIQEFRFRDCNLDELNAMCSSSNNCDVLEAKVVTCPTQDMVNDGRISFCICGGNGPYDIELVDENGTSYDTQNRVEDFTVEEFTGLQNLGPSNKYLLRVTESDGITTDLGEPGGDGIFVGINLVTCTQDDPIVDIPPINVMCGALQVTLPRVCSPSGGLEGSISFSICGGTEPYSYTFRGPGTDISERGLEGFQNYFINGVSNGSFVLEISDDDGAIITENVDITTDISQPLSVDIESINPVCEDWQFPSASGRIIATVNGGSGIHRFGWSTSPQNINTITGLDAGNYTVTVQDDVTGCVITEEIDLVYNPIIADIDIIPALCEGKSGRIEVTATGGRPRDGTDYDIEVDGFGLFVPSFSGIFNDEGLTEEHTLLITDLSQDLNCAIEMPFTIGVESDISVVANLSSGCTPSSGLISAQMDSDGTLAPNIIYELRNSAGALIQGPITVLSTEMALFENLDPDTYEVIAVEEGNGCSATSDELPYVATTGNGLSITPDIIQPACDDLGSITILGLAGMPSEYEFIWEDGLTTTSSFERIGLSPNNYNVTVTEISTGCSGSFENFVELRDASIRIDLDNETEVRIDDESPNCNGDENGFITASIINQIVRSQVTYTWYKDDVELTGENGQTISGLGAGVYRVELSGDNVCPTEKTFTFAEAMPLEIQVTQQDPVCFGEPADFSIAVLNQTGDLNITLENKITGQSLPDGPIQNDVMPGIYFITASDLSGECTDTLTYTVAEYDQLAIQPPTSTANICFSQSEAVATLDVNSISGGTGNERFFVWSDDSIPTANKLSANNLPTGEHWVYTFDDQCISDTTFFMVDGGEEIKINDANSIITQPTCFGDNDGAVELVVDGGSGTFDRFRLRNLSTGDLIPSFDNMIIGLTADTFIVQINDNNNCGGLDTLIVTQPDSLVNRIDSSGLVTLSCNTSNTGIIRTIQSGGADGPLNFNWSHDATLNSPVATNLGEDSYTSIVTDTKGCTAIATYEMQAPQKIGLDFETTQFVQCFGTRLNFGGLEPTGGTNTGFRFSINNGSLMAAADSVLLFAGDYDLSVFDQDGCSLDTSFTVIEPSEVVVELGPDVEIDLGDTHQLRAEHDPDEDIIRYVWDPSEISVDCIDCPVITVAPENDTVYGVRIVNNDGCSDEDEVMIRVKRNRNIYIPNVIYTGKSNANSSFKLFSGKGVERIEYLRIFDRWGNIVHEVEQLSGSQLGTGDWDARLKGNLIESGVYFYMARILFTDGESLDYKGDITVIH